MHSLNDLIVVGGLGTLFFLNLLSNIFLHRKISQLSFQKKVERQQIDDNEIQNALNNRLLDIQNRRYSIQNRFRGRDGT